MDDSWLHILADLPASYSLFPTPFPHYSLLEQLLFPQIIKKASIDLFFSPHFNVPFLCPVPFVITIHDLILHRYPNQASLFRRWMYRRVIGHAIRRARNIIAVSAFTQSELQKFYGDAVASKTTIVHEGVDASFSSRSSIEQGKVCIHYGIRKPFFLYVGNAKESKNVQMLIDAFVQADVDASLVLVTNGRELKKLRIPSGCHGEHCRIHDVRRANPIRVVTDIRDEDLPALYSAARCFVTASLYEGFCLPAVEAIVCRCPVIAAKCGAIPEVMGKHAMLVEPQVDKFVRALRTPPPHGSACRLYEWDHVAEATMKVLKGVL